MWLFVSLYVVFYFGNQCLSCDFDFIAYFPLLGNKNNRRAFWRDRIRILRGNWNTFPPNISLARLVMTTLLKLSNPFPLLQKPSKASTEPYISGCYCWFPTTTTHHACAGCYFFHMYPLQFDTFFPGDRFTCINSFILEFPPNAVMQLGAHYMQDLRDNIYISFGQFYS